MTTINKSVSDVNDGVSITTALPLGVAVSHQEFSLQLAANTNGQKLLEALWRYPDGNYQIGTLDKFRNRFKNIPVTDISNAVECAHAFSNQGLDVYIALAQFKTPES